MPPVDSIRRPRCAQVRQTAPVLDTAKQEGVSIM
jgi:hypothetical protein